MSDAVEILTKYGMDNAEALVRAAAKMDLPLAIAAAFASQESGGQNIYGHDAGGVYSAPGKNQIIHVTEQNYADFYHEVIVNKRRSNGVGPMQITYYGLLSEARQLGFKLWVPFDNYCFGFRLLKSYLRGDYSDASVNRAGQRYNSGSSTGAPKYGQSVVNLKHIWEKRLSGASVTLGSTSPSSSFALGSGEYYGVDDHTNASHSGVRAPDKASVKFIQSIVKTNVDGIFGKLTEIGVQSFQRQHGLVADGKVGPKTWAAMHSNK